eukprot:12427811-Karenia_brevis.AAC.1
MSQSKTVSSGFEYAGGVQCGFAGGRGCCGATMTDCCDGAPVGVVLMNLKLMVHVVVALNVVVAS